MALQDLESVEIINSESGAYQEPRFMVRDLDSPVTLRELIEYILSVLGSGGGGDKYVVSAALNHSNLVLTRNDAQTITVDLSSLEDTDDFVTSAELDGTDLVLTRDSGGTITVDLSSLGGGGGGETNTASNLGGGQGVFGAKSGVDLRFKSLVAGANITMSADANTITINSTGGGGGGSSRYSAGNGCWVHASGAGVTYAKSAGQGTITVPAGVELYSFRIVGGAADLNSGEVRITIDFDAGVAYNQSDATLYHPDITIQNRTTVLPTDPYQQRPDDAGDSINIFDEKFAAAGEVSSKVTGLSGDWGIKGTM